MTLATRIGVMNHGGIVQIGTPSDIYEYPGSRFVADFIGSVNMFEGRLVEDEPDYVRVASDELGGTFSLEAPASRFDVVNMTVGSHWQFGPNTALRMGTIFPLRDNPHRFFDSEFTVALVFRR